MSDDQFTRYAQRIDTGKMEHWTLRWPGVLMRVIVRPLLFMGLYIALILALLRWWPP